MAIKSGEAVQSKAKGQAKGQAQGQAADFVMSANYSKSVSLIAELAIDYLVFFPTRGVLLSTLAITPPLHRHSLVRRFDVRIAANRADKVAARDAGQLRAQPAAGKTGVVIDFGAPRTVAAIASSNDAKILSVAAWTGAAFALPFFPPPGVAQTAVREAQFRSEIRSDRLLVVIDAEVSVEDAGAMLLALPDLPADLAIDINGAAPVWTHNGPVLPAAPVLPKPATGDTAFDEDGARIVHLADALNALLASNSDTAPVELSLRLTSKVPGVLSLEREGAAEIDYLQRVRFDDGGSRELVFAEEGVQTLALPLPPLVAGSRRRIREIRLSVSGMPGPERVLPPVGPAPVLLADNSRALAELVVDPEHAICLRLPADSGLEQLLGLRLPLAAGRDGAEARVVLWSEAEGSPLAPMADGTSEPLSLGGSDEADAAGAAWTSFRFPKPVKLLPGSACWAALLVSRGTVRSALAGASGSEVLQGAATGPWRALPLPLRTPPATGGAAGGLIDGHGRLRVCGLAPKAEPLAPYRLQLSAAGASAAVGVTPGAKAVTVSLSHAIPVDIGSAQPQLSVTSLQAGTLTLSDIDVIWSEA